MSDVEDEMLYHKDITNPKYVGPGVWNVIHTVAIHANTAALQKNAIITITFICDNFPCETCRGHAQEYIKKNPLENSLMKNQKEELSLFLWTWTFHNAVNYRIGKHIMSKDVALQLYAPNTGAKDKLCSDECSGESKKKKKTKETKDIKHDDKGLKEGTLYLKGKKLAKKHKH